LTLPAVEEKNIVSFIIIFWHTFVPYYSVERTYNGVCAAMKTAASLSSDVTSSSSSPLLRLTRHRDDDVTRWRRRRELGVTMTSKVTRLRCRADGGESMTSASDVITAESRSASLVDDVTDGCGGIMP